ncbi:aspartyl-phosphate phosphatase Spo0E family protein [Paenibacillaceae bacterium WGS1546]|uniref:aspartyl-phosphate phosphatase Spo0E family protein n=1 Tax=Cohnella sp. WGS1546 TaxID=3366810 RepID=UPI00372CEFA7
MKNLERELEAERQRMNELGMRLLEQSHSLAEHREMQELSQKVDQLVIRYQRMKLIHKQQER